MKRKPPASTHPASTTAKGAANPRLSASTNVSGRLKNPAGTAAGQSVAGAADSAAGRLSRISRTRSARPGALASLQEQLHAQPVDGLIGGGGADSVIVDKEILRQLSAQDIRDLRLVFDTFDTRSKGLVNEHELRRAMKCLGFRMSQKATQEAIADLALSSASALNFEEFLHCVILHQGDSRDMHEEILKGFHMFDTAHKGKITLADLKRVSEETGERFSEQDLMEMIEEADRDGDNAVSKQEFVNIMLRTNLFL
ncbi:uncharacterized protein LOC135817499 [Sycon ciliatum]|uniref:uncharacterized protein LOC135817499 n=1 Tax=Sycon ciliatum TaxID=27933 RepID=UPI0020ABC2A0|eukprot:scpid82263/ scgid16287/ Caltractin; Centrin